MFHFDTLWKRQKTSGLQMEHLHKMSYWSENTTQKLSENPQYQFLRLWHIISAKIKLGRPVRSTSKEKFHMVKIPFLDLEIWKKNK